AAMGWRRPHRDATSCMALGRGTAGRDPGVSRLGPYEIVSPLGTDPATRPRPRPPNSTSRAAFLASSALGLPASWCPDHFRNAFHIVVLVLIFGNSSSKYLRSFADFTSLCRVATGASSRGMGSPLLSTTGEVNRTGRQNRLTNTSARLQECVT